MPSLWKEIATTDDVVVVRQVVAVLHKAGFGKRLSSHKNLHVVAAFLERSGHDESKKMRRRILRLSGSDLDAFVHTSSSDVFRHMLRHASTPTTLRHLLCRCATQQDLAALATNTNLDAETLRVFPVDLWSQVCAHPNLPIEVMQTVVAQGRTLARYYLAKNPVCSEPLLQILAKDSCEGVRIEARRRLHSSSDRDIGTE